MIFSVSSSNLSRLFSRLTLSSATTSVSNLSRRSIIPASSAAGNASVMLFGFSFSFDILVIYNGIWQERHVPGPFLSQLALIPVLYQSAEYNESQCTPKDQYWKNDIEVNPIILVFFRFWCVMHNYVHVYNIGKITGFVNPVIFIWLYSDNLMRASVQHHLRDNDSTETSLRFQVRYG